MSVHLIIDGYNLIRQSPRLSALDRLDLQQGRDALLDALAAYRRIRRHPITVVFDAAEAPCCSQRRDRWQGIEVRFSAPGETADAVIRRMAASERSRALVVSSDRAVVDHAAGCGAAVIGSPEFEQRIDMALAMDGAEGGEESQGWVPTTRKKGPRHRLPKRQRRQKSRIGKL